MYIEYVFKTVGKITKLPDSQTIFGAIIWNLVDFGVDKEIIGSIFSEKSENFLEVSNMFPENFLPNIYCWDNKKYELIVKYTADEKSKKWFFQNASYKDEEGKRSYKSTPWVAEKRIKKELHRAVTHKTMNNTQQIISGSDGVFSQKYEEYSVDGQIINQYFFWVKCNETVKKELDKVLGVGSCFLKLGPRSTKGMNLFELIEEQEYEPQCSDAKIYLNLGTLGGNNLSNVDIDNSHIKSYTSQRKGYYDYKDVYNVQYIAASSVICLKNGKQEVERYQVIEENKKYLYTAGFLLPLCIQEGGE